MVSARPTMNLRLKHSAISCPDLVNYMFLKIQQVASHRFQNLDNKFRVLILGVTSIAISMESMLSAQSDNMTKRSSCMSFKNATRPTIMLLHNLAGGQWLKRI